MNEQELIEHLISEIENHGIEVIGDASFPLDAITNNKKKITVFNPTVVTAFKLSHELAHIINGDAHRCGECDTISSQEKLTNKGAILYLWNIFEKKGGTSDDINRFIEITDCPDKLTKIVILKSKIKDWDREEIRSQVDAYLDRTDTEPESWNIYNIMGACHIDYKWEHLVKSFIEEYCLKWFHHNHVG